MSIALPQSSPENSQQALRFTVRGPVLDEAIIALEREGDRHGSFLPQKLFLYSMKRIELDDVVDADGINLSHSVFGQYRKRIFDIAVNGRKEFNLDSNLHEIKAGGQRGNLVGVGFRVRFNDFDIDQIIAPPLYGVAVNRRVNDDENELNVRNAANLLSQAREGGYIPVFYRIGQTIDDPGYAVERLKSVLRLGANVAELAVVPLRPKAARERDIYPSPPIDRTYNRVDAFFEERTELGVGLTAPIPLQGDEENPDSSMKNAS